MRNRNLRASGIERPPVTKMEVAGEYRETGGERQLVFAHGGEQAVLTQPATGYGMVSVRASRDGPEIERYYGLEMALDHAAELLDVSGTALRVPTAAADMGI